MNKIKALEYCIVFLMAFQSVIGMADTHQVHQSGAEHHTFDDSHHHSVVVKQIVTDSQIKPAVKTPRLITQDSDCHHCCHCHSHFSPAIASDSLSFSIKKRITIATTCKAGLFSESIPPLLRPPISYT